MKPSFVSLVVTGFFAASLGSVAEAANNIGDARAAVEARGGQVIYGKHFDHVEYVVAAAAIGSGNGTQYLVETAKSVGFDLGTDVLQRLLNGESVDVGGKTLQAGFITYNHWGTNSSSRT